MKKSCFSFNFKKILVLFVVTLGFGQYVQAFDNYYTKMTAVQTGNGKVYVSTSQTSNPTYTSDNSSSTQRTGSSTGGNSTYYLYAKGDEGYGFAYWSSDNAGSDELSTDSPWVLTVNGPSDQNTETEEYIRYAVFKPLPQFRFSADATSVPAEGGVVSASVAGMVYGEYLNSTSASTTATFAVTTIARGYYWIGWNDAATGTTKTEQTITPTITNTTAGSTATLTKYAIFGLYEDPESIAASNLTINKGDNVSISYTLSPAGCFKEMSFSSDDEGVATVDADGKVLGVGVGTATITITANKIDTSATPITKTITVTVKEQCATPMITFSNVTETDADVTLTTTTTEATIYYTINGATPTASSTTYSAPFSVNAGDVIRAIAIVSGNTQWTPSEVVTKTYTAQKVATPSIVTSGDGTISFTCSEEGTVTYTYCISDDGDCTPTTVWNGTPIAKDLTNNEKIITVIASKDGCIDSDPATKQYTASGISGNKVILNDYEDHNWSYYKGLDYTFDDGTTYKDKYRYSIYSPDPRNVKITYRGFDTDNSTIDLGGTDKVEISTLNENTAPHVSNVEGEGQNTFVYYKTLEKFVIGFFVQQKTGDDYDGTPDDPDDESQWYPYTVISNPFSVRPSKGSGDDKVYYGFAGWKIISGGDKILEYNNNDVIPLDAVIHFTGMKDGYTPNCTSADVVLEATWTQATVETGTGAKKFSGGTYETNFYVVRDDNAGTVNQSYPCTIMAAYYPDGTTNTDNTTRTITGLTVSTTGDTPATNTVKVEYIRHGNGTFNANGNNLTLGRGITSSSNNGNTAQGNVYNCNSDKGCVNTVKVESGYYSVCRPLGSVIASGKDLNAYIIFGCDYDRANADYFSTRANGYNTKLRISSLGWSQMSAHNRTNGQLYLRTLFKSGIVEGAFYAHKSSTTGQRFITMEGGYVQGDFTGGSENDLTQHDARSLTFRGKGNFRMDGRVAGGSTQNNCSGDRCIALTGGTIAGWVAAGSNSRQTTGGVTTGETFVYIGGNAQIDSRGDTKLYNTSSGGVVYGAGCGINHNSTSGAVTKGSNVILADNAYVERGIYGGGAMGRISDGQSSNIFVLGGHVGTGVGTITDSANPTGQQNVTVSMTGVFGGACNVGGGGSNIYMNGGVVEGGVFGGSNITGTMANDVNIQIVGGQVGTSTAPANVHGGGYGSDTDVKGAVTVTLGESGATEGATIYGGTYGGSALGTISSTSTINVNAGTFKGGIYGGGLGNESTSADVAGKSTVNMTGGVAEGGVYGGGNINSTVGGNVEMHIDGGQIGLDADHTANIHGGGYGSKTVVAGNVDVTLGVATEDETAKGATIYGNVYGGSALGKVNGSGDGTSINTGAHTNVTMNLGSVNGSIFGGGMGELSGTGRSATAVAGEGVVNGQINVAINGTDATIVTDDVRDYAVDGVFGGCDMVAYAGTPVVVINNCATSIDYVYGGGNAAAVSGTDVTINGGDINWAFGGGNGEDEAKPGADVNGDVSLTITGGTVNNIFGGSNTLGNITGKCDVIVEEGEDVEGHCPIAVGELYGGGNKAELYVAPNLDIRCLRGKLDAIYGGAKAADVHSDINLVIKSGQYGKVFGGNNQSGTIYGSINVTVEETGCEPIVIGELYGCGNMAAYDKANDPDTPQDPQVNIISCTSIGAIYGGGLGETAVVTGNPVVSIQQEVGDHATAVDADGDGEADNKADAIGVIGDVFGGGNAAKVVGSTQVKIGTDIEVKGADGAIYKDNDNKAIPASANIRGNVYGGGNKAEVTGDTKVIVGPTKN